MENICCKEKLDLTNTTVNTLIVNCCCKCGNNGGGDNPEPPTPETPKIYGIRIDKNNPDPAGRITYTNDAVGMKPAFMNFETGQFDYGDWKNVWFVKENKPVMLNYDGTEAYDLNSDDYSKKLDGTPSDVANPDFPGNAMAVIPLVWLKSWEDDQYEYCNFADYQADETYRAYAHTRADGTIMDKRYMRMFGGSLVNEKLRSLSGQRLISMQTATAEVTYAQANNASEHVTLWYTTSWSEWNLISLLCILMGKSDNSQAVFGRGHESGGYLTSHILPSGTLSHKGQFYGDTSSSSQVKVFHLEKVWGDQWERIAGAIYPNGVMQVKPYPPYNINGDAYINTGITISGISEKRIVKTKSTKYGRFAVSVGGEESTYACNMCTYDNAVNSYAFRGGDCVNKGTCGIWAICLSYPASHEYWGIGAGLSCEQPKRI